MYIVKIMAEDFAAFKIYMDNKADANSLAMDYEAKGYTVKVEGK